MLLEGNRHRASPVPPSGGSAASPTPHPIVEAAKPPLLHCWFSRASRSSSFLIVSSRVLALPVPGRAASGASSSSLLLSCPLSLAAAKAAVVVHRRQFSRLALKGGRESFLLFSQLEGSAASLQTTHPIVGGPTGLLLHCSFSPASRSPRRRHRQFPDARLPVPGRRPRELPLPPPCSLAGSRW